MVTHSEKVAELKAKYPTIKSGDDIAGYIELNAEEYEAKIAEWAKVEISNAENEAAAIAADLKKQADKEALLIKLGITEDEAKLLLS